MGAMAVFSGVLPRPLPGADGALTAEAGRLAIRPPVYYLTRTGLIALENTHNMAGGAIFPPQGTQGSCAPARARRSPTHPDGGRIFKAGGAPEGGPGPAGRPGGSG